MRLTQRFLRLLHRDRPAKRKPTTHAPGHDEKAVAPMPSRRERTDLAGSEPASAKAASLTGPSADADDPRSDVAPVPAGGPVEGTVRRVPKAASDAEAALPDEVEGKPRPRSTKRKHGRKR